MYQVSKKEGQQQVYEACNDDVDPHKAFLSSRTGIPITDEPNYLFLLGTYALISDIPVILQPDLDGEIFLLLNWDSYTIYSIFFLSFG
jgi:hypothetical protein